MANDTARRLTVSTHPLFSNRSAESFFLSTDWSDVYGLDFSPLKPAAINKGFLRVPGPQAVVTDATCVLDLDLQNIQISELDFDSIPFQVVANRRDTVHAFLAWFDYDFTAGRRHLHVSTGPFSPTTHWKQTVFYLGNPLKVHEGQTITGYVSFEQYQRDLNVRLAYELGIFTNGQENGNTNGDTKATKSTSGYSVYKVYVSSPLVSTWLT
jgi:hypothetical protein